MFVKSTLILFLFYVSDIEGFLVSRPGYAYYAQLRGSLKLHAEPADWLSARVACHGEDALLASPWNAQFTSAVRELQANEDQSLPVLFSGVQVLFAEGVYRNDIEGLPSVLMELERCGVFYQNGTTGDVSCTERLPFVCYAPGPTPAPTPSCEGKSPGYEFSDRTQHCYKLHTQGAYWTDANRTCVAEGARLAVPNSEDEERVLVELYQRYPDEAIHDTFSTGLVHVGIYRHSGVWRTVDGQTLAQAGRAHWAPGEPYFEDSLPYGLMYSDGTLFNMPGFYKRAFICEM